MTKPGRIILTGASGGLGTSVLSQLWEDGWPVSAIIRNPDNVTSFRKRFPEVGLQVLAADLTTEEGVAGIFSGTDAIYGVVHLAGGFTGAGTLAETTSDTFDRMFNLNIRSAFLVLQAAMPLLKPQGGAIVTIGAKPALHPTGENAVYAASKAALINLTLSAAEEGRRDHVRANAIVPAVIRTKSNLAWASSPEEAEKWTPPEDIARVISWLLSDEGASVTGTIIPLYHGLTC